jgi:FOG: Ankyrin repeat
MSIFEDARKDTLDKRRLDDHRLKDSAVLTRLDPATGYTPLATAVVAGHAYLARDLIEWGANPAGLSGDGETPLLLAAWKAEKEQALLIHYLLRYAPKTVDMTCQAAGNKTPLMFAVEKEDLRSIRELRKHGASVGIKDDDGFSALQRAEAQAGGKGRKSLVMLALDPIQEKAVRDKVAMFALNSVLLVVSIADKLIKGALRAISRWNPSKLFKRKKVKVVRTSLFKAWISSGQIIFVH